MNEYTDLLSWMCFWEDVETGAYTPSAEDFKSAASQMQEYLYALIHATKQGTHSIEEYLKNLEESVKFGERAHIQSTGR